MVSFVQFLVLIHKKAVPNSFCMKLCRTTFSNICDFCLKFGERVDLFDLTILCSLHLGFEFTFYFQYSSKRFYI